MKKEFVALALLFFLETLSLFAQSGSPVSFQVKTERTAPDEIQLVYQGNIQAGWHIYSSDMKEGGPAPTQLVVEESKGIKPIGKLAVKSPVQTTFDDMLDMEIRYLEKSATFVQRFQIVEERYSVKGYLEYEACNDRSCTPPSQVPFEIKGTNDVKSDITEENELKDTIKSEILNTDSVAKSADSIGIFPTTWSPVSWSDSTSLHPMQSGQSSANAHLWWILLMGLLGGLLAVVTPCVWPIIPMTISYFLKRAEHKGHGLRDALCYGASIIIIYVGFGWLITWIWGANGLNALSTSAVFNLICFFLLILFAASFLGGFDLTLPASWSNKLNDKADKSSGFIGIFFMALTLTIVSFSCTGPIVGFLLVDISSANSIWAPLMGMLGFAIALALPFTLFALFPSWLKKMPKSGSWMNKIKVTLGFVELAFALKFLSVADMAYGWRMLDREVFLVLWIALFLILGLYWLGLVRFPSDEKSGHCTVTGFFVALISISFALYLIPGLWGAPLKAVSAFTPPMWTQDFKPMEQGTEVKAQFTDYDAALAYAKQSHKPLMLDFTGYGCVNCRKMEAAVWTDPTVRKHLNDDFVLVSLFVDDRTPLPSPRDFEVNGETKTVRTQGQLWSLLQNHKFGANVQPFYVAITADGVLLNSPYSYDENVQKFTDFIEKSLQNFRSQETSSRQ